MNAAEQVKSVKIASKVATAVNLFKVEFPDAKADLKPWRNDPDTRDWLDPDSIDIGFHFPGWSPRLQGRSLLVQIRFFQDPIEDTYQLIGLEIAAFNHQGEAWRLSTIHNWQFEGNYLPTANVSKKLKHFCRQVFEVFRN